MFTKSLIYFQEDVRISNISIKNGDYHTFKMISISIIGGYETDLLLEQMEIDIENGDFEHVSTYEVVIDGLLKVFHEDIPRKYA